MDTQDFIPFREIYAGSVHKSSKLRSFNDKILAKTLSAEVLGSLFVHWFQLSQTTSNSIISAECYLESILATARLASQVANFFNA